MVIVLMVIGLGKRSISFSFLVRKVLSKKVTMKFLPKLLFVKDESFDYAEKIESLIKQTNRQG